MEDIKKSILRIVSLSEDCGATNVELMSAIRQFSCSVLDKMGECEDNMCGSNVEMFKSITGSFCKKCGFVYPF